ncbi:heterogeneous nuclear ribonucleoprotein A/B-like [Vulpes vulpes]|uniref:Heterogeneous nuclear ribonucleoprotein A/B-like n=1 Tax=Vulpes vulpes TaxID=9627 RepID=A0ABM4YCK4_VULVU
MLSEIQGKMLHASTYMRYLKTQTHRKYNADCQVLGEGVNGELLVNRQSFNYTRCCRLGPACRRRARSGPRTRGPARRRVARGSGTSGARQTAPRAPDRRQQERGGRGKNVRRGLRWDSRQEDLRIILPDLGRSLTPTKTDPSPGRSRGVGFILFKDAASVEKLLDQKEHRLHGRVTGPKKARAMKKDPVKEIVCRGPSPEATGKGREYFGEFGEIEAMELPKDPKSHKRRGSVFVTLKEKHLPVKKVLERKLHQVAQGRVPPPGDRPPVDYSQSLAVGRVWGSGARAASWADLIPGFPEPERRVCFPPPLQPGPVDPGCKA